MLIHIPVLSKEVLQFLDPQPNQDYIDCTLGLGGHAALILEQIKPKGRLLGIEQNAEGLARARENLSGFQGRIKAVEGNFSDLRAIAGKYGFRKVSGILLDLGLASWQIEQAHLGITFSQDEILDMRLSRHCPITAREIVNRYSLKQLADVFYHFGDIRNSFRLAKKIIQFREKQRIKTTFDLKKAIGSDNPRILAPIFQALRIEVNQELENLRKVLTQTLEILESGARLVVISYHSGEDRIVKNFFREHRDQIKILFKKPIIATPEEIKKNSRARSAKMRVGERL